MTGPLTQCFPHSKVMTGPLTHTHSAFLTPTELYQGDWQPFRLSQESYNSVSGISRDSNQTLHKKLDLPQTASVAPVGW